MGHIRLHLSEAAMYELRRRSSDSGRNISVEAAVALEATLRDVDLRTLSSRTTIGVERAVREREATK